MFQPMIAEPITDCPKCAGAVKRLIGAGAGPIFKGSGFYQTDYKNKSVSSAKSTPAKTAKPKSSEKEKTASNKKSSD
jgi:predicted nucleic acid-binding Zn ribbon protein